MGIFRASCKGPDPKGDEGPGCPDGASLVKVQITLAPGGERGCEVAELKPEKVCVLQGGAIRWKVDNRCDLPATPDDPPLKITGPEVEWLTTACDASFRTLERGMARGNQLFCNVPDGAEEGSYKYAVEGPGVDRLDPRIVVRGPGGGGG